MPNLHKFGTVWTIKIVIALPLKQRNKQTNNLDFPVLCGGSTFEIGHFEVWGVRPKPHAEEEWAKVEMNDLLDQIC